MGLEHAARAAPVDDVILQKPRRNGVVIAEIRAAASGRERQRMAID